MNEKTYQIKVKGTLVDVNKETYMAYYRSKRRDRYFEHDIKYETAVYDGNGNITGYKPEKEDSLDRLIEAGADFTDESESVEDKAVKAVMAKKLHSVLQFLDDDEQELIEALFFSNNGAGMSEREYAELNGIPRKTVAYRRDKILDKLKKLFKK